MTQKALTRWLSLGGVVGPLAFVLTFTAAGLLRPGYSPIHRAISDLGVGPDPWLLNVSAVALGAVLVAFCAGFRRALGPALGDPWQWLCPVLLALPGIGLAWAGVFTEAPATLALHWMVGMPLVAVGSVAGFILTGWRLRGLPGWRGLGTYSIVAGVATFALLLVMFGTWTLGIGGLLERACFIELLAWYVIIGWKLFGVAEAEAPTGRRLA
jgi:hypothetical membrane protein